MSWPHVVPLRTHGRGSRFALAVGVTPLVVGVVLCGSPAVGSDAPVEAAASGAAVAGHEKGNPMNTHAIAHQIEAKDWDLLERPPSSEQASEVIGMLEHADPEVRELAVSLLDRMGGSEVKASLFRALDDENQMVRGIAARSVRHHCTGADVPALVERLQHHDDDYVREQVALALGTLGDKAAIEPLRIQFAREGYPDAKHAMSLALARLGDAEHRQAYLDRLIQNGPPLRVAALEDLPYLNDRTLAQEIVPLLEDLRDAKNVGPSHGPFWIRVCDVAVNSLDELLDHPFPFKVEVVKRYTQAELDQARAALR
jgi:HEAT repeat protein